MSRFTRFIMIPILITLLVGCVPANNPQPSKQSVKSAQARAQEPKVAESDQASLSAGNAAFALDLYHALNKPQNNFFYSPYSISLALAMTYGGARGSTEKQMADTLHFTLPQEKLHPAFNALDQELAKRKDTPGQGVDGKGFRLNIANDIWGQQNYTFQAAYLDLLAANYGAGLRLMNFQGDPEGARKAINDYIAQKTEQRIKDLVPQGAIDELTRMVLTNAIYFNAAWLNPFEKDLTKDGSFTHLDGSKVTVPLMKRPAHGSLSYLAGDGFQAVALPYEGSQISMLLLVPDQGKFADFESKLNAGELESILGKMDYQQVVVTMPKFKMESEFSLKGTLAGMGMKDAFDPNIADFSGMDGKRDLYIGAVLHKSFVKVDEAGTEAAASTAVVMEATAAQAGQPVQLVIDRPFIFLIRDEPTNTILFMGRVLDPAQ